MSEKENRKEPHFYHLQESGQEGEQEDNNNSLVDKEPKRRWTYFSEKEVEGLSEDLVFKLDRARGLYEFPIYITSGFRDPNKNDLVGGVKDSEHIMGHGADIKAPLEPYLREKLAWALGAAGIRRLGTYARHFHIGISVEHPNPQFWVGDYK